MPQKHPGGGKRVAAARSDGNDAVVGFDHVAGTGYDERLLAVDHGQQCLEPAKILVRPPVLGEFDGRPFEIPPILFEFGLEFFRKRERVGGRTGEAGEHGAAVHLPHLAAVMLHHRLSDRHLAVGPEHRLAVPNETEDGGRTDSFLFHGIPLSIQLDHSSLLRSRATGISIASRYLATVRRAMLNPRCVRISVSA